MIRKNTFIVSKTTDLSATTDYNMDASSDEGISWRNIHGTALVDVAQVEIDDVQIDLDPVALIESGFNIPAAGVYDVQVVSDLYSGNLIDVRITSGSSFNKLSPSVDTLDVIVDASEDGWQYQVIPGIKIKIRPYTELGGISEYDRFQVVVGGRWLAEEDRNLEDLMFGLISANEPSSGEIKLTVKNNSGVTLTNVQAKVVNKISIYQNQIQLDKTASENTVVRASPYYEGHLPIERYSLPGGALTDYIYQTHSLDLVVAPEGVNWTGEWHSGHLYCVNDGVSYSGSYYVTIANIEDLPPGTWSPPNYPWVSFTSQIIHDNPQIKTYSPSIFLYGDKTTVPFRRDILVINNDFWVGAINQADYSWNGYPPYTFYNYLRYDFGEDNTEIVNVVGLSGWSAAYVTYDIYDTIYSADGVCSLWGSQDNFDVPENWDKLTEIVDFGTPCRTSAGGYISYTAFPNTKAYRHYAFVQEKSDQSIWKPNVWLSPVIQVMELLYTPNDSLVINRDRPFVLIDQSGDQNPPYEVGAYPKEIRFEITDEITAMTVDGESWDVDKIYMGEDLAS
jgi:hypothetical protein